MPEKLAPRTILLGAFIRAGERVLKSIDVAEPIDTAWFGPTGADLTARAVIPVGHRHAQAEVLMVHE